MVAGKGHYEIYFRITKYISESRYIFQNLILLKPQNIFQNHEIYFKSQNNFQNHE